MLIAACFPDLQNGNIASISDILRETRMANPEHEAVVRQGAKSLSLWRMSHPQVRLNLKEADLSGLDLYKIRLKKADLREANLF